MQVHHLDCGTSRSWAGRLLDGRCPVSGRARLVCHCLLIEADDRLVLVDTGFGSPAIGTLHARPEPRQDTARVQIERLGYSARDVRHVVLTHLDFDHAGGLDDFPEARVHVYEDELAAAMQPRGWVARRRYRHVPGFRNVRWKTYALKGDRWHGFEVVRQLDGAPPEILLVPLPGHTAGHCGVAVRAPSGWLLHAGDAYHARAQLEAAAACGRLLRWHERVMDFSHANRMENQQRLRDLARRTEGIVDVFCAHDAAEFERHATPYAGPPWRVTRASRPMSSAR